jgi:hypothetical protein
MIVRFEVTLSATMKKTVFWNVMPYSFIGGCYLHLQVRRYHSYWLSLKPISFSSFSASLTVLSQAAYYLKYGGSRFVRNIDIHLPNYTAPFP